MQNRFGKLFGANSISSATVILIITLFISNILGVVRDHYLAQKISTNLLDTYYAAFRIPDLIFNILVLGAITASFIPIFSKYLNGNNNLKKAWHIANSFLNISALFILISSIALFFLMPYLVPILVPKFDLAKQTLTVNLSRLLLISPILFTLSYIFGAILNSFKRFFVYSLAPLVYNLCIIIATVFWANEFNVYAVTYGVIIGAFFHMLIQFVQLRKIGYKFNFAFDFADSSVRQIFYLMIPRTIGLGANQIMLFVYTAIASTLAAGSVAIFNLADNIQTMPTVVFGISLATAIFPTLAEHINTRKIPEFTQHIFKSIKAVAYILIPLSILVILLREPIVRLILGSGEFGWDQTIATYNTLGFFAISLFPQGIIPLLARAFYAMSDTKTPTIVSILSVVLGIVFAYILTPQLKIQGLALAFTLASFFNAITLYFLLKKKISFQPEENHLQIYIAKIIAASIVMGIIVFVFKNLLITHIGAINLTRFWGVSAQFFISAAIGLLTYLYISRKLKLGQYDEFINLIKRFFAHNGQKQSK